MKNPEELSREELVSIVENVRDILFFEDGELNRDKEWGVDFLDNIAEILDNSGLLPD